MKSAQLKPLLLSVAVLTGCAHEHPSVRTQAVAHPETAAAPAPPAPAAVAAVRSEQMRKDCIQGRRLICGKVLQVFPDGLVVDSGYTDLLRPPLTESWVVPGTVPAHRNPAVLELNEPGTPSIGLVFLTDIPKRQKVKQFDYVILMGYPAAQYIYEPAPGVKKTIRKFSAGLDTAVRLKLQADNK
ncbi:MAG TPA: hypothetical protein VG938_03420 [Verrucomicrobiae bacterium]|jgi:hypothetical protein|nr:hypothetical protein [Verrucomicrobiae bacterium]